jgi:hypothetical protein
MLLVALTNRFSFKFLASAQYVDTCARNQVKNVNKFVIMTVSIGSDNQFVYVFEVDALAVL